MPRVSILLTCYNHLPFLKPCLDGVLGQTLCDFEVLALDDGSTDGTRDWLSDQKDSRIKLIFNEKNLGTYATLNVGLAKAKGEYIAVLNDDDLWSSTKLERQVSRMDSSPKVALAHTGGTFIDGDGKELTNPTPLGFPFPRTPSGKVLATLVESNKICTSAALIRREVVEKVGAFDPTFYGMGDWQMWLRIAREFEVGYVDEPLTHYRVHGQNASMASESMLKDDLRIREWIAGWIHPHEPEMHTAAAQNWAALGHLRMMLGDAKGSRVALREAMKLQPGRTKTRLRYLASYLPQGIRNRIG